MFETVLNEYCEHFKVNGIPTYAFLSVSDEDMIAMMRKAIAENKPIEPEYDPECDY